MAPHPSADTATRALEQLRGRHMRLLLELTEAQAAGPAAARRCERLQRELAQTEQDIAMLSPVGATHERAAG